MPSDLVQVHFVLTDTCVFLELSQGISFLCCSSLHPCGTNKHVVSWNLVSDGCGRQTQENVRQKTFNIPIRCVDNRRSRCPGSNTIH